MAEVEEIFSGLSLEEKPEIKLTGLIFDDRMTQHRCLWYQEHNEKPERYVYPLERCRNYGLIERCVNVPSRFATEEELSLIHSPNFIELVRNTKNVSDEAELERLSSDFDAVYFHPKTYECALLAAGCTLELVSAVIEEKVNNGMAVVRPPGHHAMHDEACGFCFFNNVALAAKYALTKYKLSRILIIDWDAHHGQGTQRAFYEDPRVLYFSMHRYEHGDFWPNLKESNFDCVGEGCGKGFNFNVPLNKTGLGNTEVLAIFHNILLPVAYEFNPELILVSAGFDMALGCPEGEMEVTPHLYPHLLQLVSGLAEGRVCVVLEGGYCLPSLSEGVALCLRGLLGDPCPRISPADIIDDSIVETILNVITVQRQFWECLRLQRTYKAEEDKVGLRKHLMSVKYVCNSVFGKPYPTRDCNPIQEESTRLMLESKLEKLIGMADLTVPEQRTCVVSDLKMREHVNKREKRHPESPERLTRINEKLKEMGILKKCFRLPSRKATEDELGLVHSPSYISAMNAIPGMKNKELARLEMEYQSVYFCQETYESALIACGCLLQAVDAVLTGKCLNGFALIRPPGHHADEGEACGFCIFNSVAVAAKYAQAKYAVRKILIVDWDVHHGNGTQHVFYEDDSVLYVSLHRYDDGSFFPSDSYASHESCGKNAGTGYTINIPWNSEVCDGDYLSALSHIVLPVAYEFCPDLVLISAGFDAAQHDPLGGCKLSPPFYGHMTKLLSGLAGGKMVLALEGGYNLDSLADAVYYSLSALLSEPCRPLAAGLVPTPQGIDVIRRVVEVHQKFWKCLQFGVEVPEQKGADGGGHIADHSVISAPVAIPNANGASEPQAAGNQLESMQIHFSGAEGTSPMMYCVSPLSWCPHLELLQSLPPEGLNPNDPCLVCGDPRENWVCLHCYQVYCGRFINQHMLQHGLNMQHYLTLSYSDFSVWCYACDSYVHNEALMEIKQHVHVKKFSVPIG